MATAIESIRSLDHSAAPAAHLAEIDVLCEHAARKRRADVGPFEVELRFGQCRAGRADASFGGIQLGFTQY